MVTHVGGLFLADLSHYSFPSLQTLMPLSLCLSLDSAVTDSINQLISMCTKQAPGQKECDNALRELEVLLFYFSSSVCSSVCVSDSLSGSDLILSYLNLNSTVFYEER